MSRRKNRHRQHTTTRPSSTPSTLALHSTPQKDENARPESCSHIPDLISSSAWPDLPKTQEHVVSVEAKDQLGAWGPRHNVSTYSTQTSKAAGPKTSIEPLDRSNSECTARTTIFRAAKHGLLRHTLKSGLAASKLSPAQAPPTADRSATRLQPSSPKLGLSPIITMADTPPLPAPHSDAEAWRHALLADQQPPTLSALTAQSPPAEGEIVKMWYRWFPHWKPGYGHWKRE